MLDRFSGQPDILQPGRRQNFRDRHPDAERDRRGHRGQREGPGGTGVEATMAPVDEEVSIPYHP